MPNEGGEPFNHEGGVPNHEGGPPSHEGGALIMTIYSNYPRTTDEISSCSSSSGGSGGDGSGSGIGSGISGRSCRAITREGHPPTREG